MSELTRKRQVREWGHRGATGRGAKNPMAPRPQRGCRNKALRNVSS